MDQGSNDLRVVVSNHAAEDLANIHTYTTSRHERAQARLYIDFLNEAIQECSSSPTANSIEELPGMYFVLAKWPGARAGHKIVFLATDDGVIIVRVLHTSMNLIDHIRIVDDKDSI